MYVSDYMYAVDPSGWLNVGYEVTGTTDYRAIKGDNWMYAGFVDWTISRCSDNTEYAFYVSNTSYVSYATVDSTYYAVRPVFYLNSDVQIYEGNTGTASDPYRIVI